MNASGPQRGGRHEASAAPPKPLPPSTRCAGWRGLPVCVRLGDYATWNPSAASDPALPSVRQFSDEIPDGDGRGRITHEL